MGSQLRVIARNMRFQSSGSRSKGVGSFMSKGAPAKVAATLRSVFGNFAGYVLDRTKRLEARGAIATKPVGSRRGG